MNVLSLCDGIGCARLALERVGIQVDKYYASEIDPYAIKVTQHNYPDTIQLGSIVDVKGDSLGDIGIILGGFPCQSFSFAGKQLNFDDPRGKLFFEVVRILNEVRNVNPDVLFLFENVKMSEKNEQVINKYLGVRPIRLNSDMITAQSRQRLYWTNIPVNSIPRPQPVILQDIISDGYVTDRLKSYCIDANYGKGSNPRSYAMGRRQILFKTTEDMCHFIKNGKATRTKDVSFRILTPEECEALQTIPIGYTSILPKTRRYHAIGNGWTIDIVAHILKHIK